MRWLLPIIAAFALLGHAALTYAAAGVVGQASCCCPQPSACKCVDHEPPARDAELQRCGGEAKLVAPAPVIAIAMPARVPLVVSTTRAEPPSALVRPVDPPARAPDTPPF